YSESAAGCADACGVANGR
ncbi:endodeoxyribonuclease RusA family protein, partial [Escherichia coli 90.0091]